MSFVIARDKSETKIVKWHTAENSVKTHEKVIFWAIKCPGWYLWQESAVWDIVGLTFETQVRLLGSISQEKKSPFNHSLMSLLFLINNGDVKETFKPNMRQISSTHFVFTLNKQRFWCKQMFFFFFIITTKPQHPGQFLQLLQQQKYLSSQNSVTEELLLSSRWGDLKNEIIHRQEQWQRLT